MAEFTFEWRQQPKQIQFLDACGLAFPFLGGAPKAPLADRIGYGGAAGGGKSDALLMVGIIAGFTFKGINIGYFRRKFTELQGPGGAIMRSSELLARKAKWNGSLHRWTFPGGASLTFCHLNTDGSVHDYQSQQFDIMLFDEETQFSDFQIDYMTGTRNRATKDTIIKPFSASATNPGGIGHARFKEQFVEIGEPGKPHEYVNEEGKAETRLFIPSFLSDNQALEERDPSYRVKLEARPEHLRRQLLEGDWDVAEGMAFSEWKKSIHVCKWFDIPESWTKFRALDWGYAKPFCVGWYAVDFDGRLYKYREFYGWNGKKNEGSKLDPEDVAEHIIKLEQGEHIRYAVADDAIFGGKQDSGPDISEKFAKAFGNRATHWAPVGKGPKSRIFGKTELHYRLKWEKDENKDWNGELPMLVVFENCIHTIRTLPNLIVDPDNTEDVESDIQEDHCIAGETKVVTDQGEKPISELVGTEGFVLSHDGLYHHYSDCRLTQSNAPVFTVELKDGRKITATVNHRFMLTDGTWKRLDELDEGDDILEVTRYDETRYGTM
jgi:hypothetical protein